MTDKALRSLPALVLVVEDDTLLRELAVEMLEEAGFAVLEAGNADEAIVVLETRPDIAALFTDINMPGTIDGLALAHAVRERWPRIKILVASGRVRLLPYDLPADSAFLGKPYCGEAVITRLHALIGPAGCRLPRGAVVAG